MLRISKLTDYALLVLVRLHHSDSERLSAQTLAEQLGLEPPTVSKVLKSLASAGLVFATRGAHGGYSLAAPAAEIPVVTVIEALEGPIALTECGVESGLCSHESECRLKGNWHRISQAVRGALSDLSLADMAQPLPKSAIQPILHSQRAV